MQGAKTKSRRQELREDEFVNKVMAAWYYLEANYTRVIAAAGGVVVVVLLGVFIKQQMDANTQEAVEAIGRTRVLLLQGQVDNAITEAERIAQDYSGKAEAGRALYMSASLYFETGRHAEAQSAFERYLDTYGAEGPSGYGAWAGVAACMEEQDNLEGAAVKYLAYADQFGQSIFAPIALKEAARCYRLAGNQVEAGLLLKRIVDDYAKSPGARGAEAELKQIASSQ